MATPADVVAAAVAFLARGGNAERYLSRPRCAGCAHRPDPCATCESVTHLAELALHRTPRWQASARGAQDKVVHYVLADGSSACGGNPPGSGWVAATCDRRCVSCTACTRPTTIDTPDDLGLAS